MMFVLTFRLNVDIHPGSITERLKEVEKHLYGHLSYFFTLELCVPHQPRPAAKIKTHLTQAIVHRKGIAIALNASLTAQHLIDARSQCQRCIFNRVMFVDLPITFDYNIQNNTGMLAYLLEHVIEKSQSGINMTNAVSSKIERYTDICFLSGALHGCSLLPCKKKLGNTVPIGRSQHTDVLQSFFLQHLGRRLQQNSLTFQFFSQFHIRGAVAYDKATSKIIHIGVQIVYKYAMKCNTIII